MLFIYLYHIQLNPKFQQLQEDKSKHNKKIKEEDDEKRLRDGIVSKYKMTHEKQLKEQREKIKEMEGVNVT